MDDKIAQLFPSPRSAGVHTDLNGVVRFDLSCCGWIMSLCTKPPTLTKQGFSSTFAKTRSLSSLPGTREEGAVWGFESSHRAPCRGGLPRLHSLLSLSCGLVTGLFECY